VVKNLRAEKINAIAVHGGYSQEKRNSTIQSFHAKSIPVLVCTDVASRGLDIKGVTHIYNYDLPKESKQYIHRIGRTARAGENGKAISLLTDRDHDNFSRVLRDFDINIEKLPVPRIERVRISFLDERSRTGGFDQQRGPGRDGFRGSHPATSENRSYASQRGPGRDGFRGSRQAASEDSRGYTSQRGTARDEFRSRPAASEESPSRQRGPGINGFRSKKW
jgi:superfamily II DNA/RNA helicase